MEGDRRDQTINERLLAKQLQAVIRTHLHHYGITPSMLAEKTGYTQWAIDGMLGQQHWHFTLCLDLLEVLNIKLSITEAE